jgi:surfactin synthase thioesterase subunit
LDNAGEGFYNAAANLGKTIEAERAGKPEVAAAWRLSSGAYKEQAKALLQRDEKVAELHEKRALALGGNYGRTGAATAYESAANAEAEGKSKVAALWRASAKASKKQDEALLKQAEALLQRDERAAELHKKRALALGGNYGRTGAVYAYESAANAEAEGKSKVAAFWRASAEASKEQAKALLEQAKALFQRDERAAELHGKRSKILGGNQWEKGAAFAYESAANAEAEGKSKVSQQWCRIADTYTRSTNSYLQAASAHAEVREEKRLSLNKVGDDFCNATEKLVKAIVAEAKGKPEVAQQLRKEAQQKIETTMKAIIVLNNPSVADSFWIWFWFRF